jgi:AraC family transcriptional regulator of adaptative response/methylated-DNA-[protein]-cysteine methyltransferase
MRFKAAVSENDVITSLYESGFGSSRSLYEKAGERMGMTPAIYKKGGKGMTIDYTIVDSKLGHLIIAATEKGVCAVSLGDDPATLESELRGEFPAAAIERNDARLKDAANSISRSFDGDTAILDLPLDLQATAFQMRVWSELRRIPFGETRTYGEIAQQIGDPRSVRAVARACATNPVALVTPCHRVIAANGKLSGYRWGIERKEKLLSDEKAAVANTK